MRPGAASLLRFVGPGKQGLHVGAETIQQERRRGLVAGGGSVLKKGVAGRFPNWVVPVLPADWAAAPWDVWLLLRLRRASWAAGCAAGSGVAKG